MGENRASVDEVYQARLDDLVDQAAAQWDAATGSGLRPWQHPVLEGEAPAVHAIEPLGDGFDREALNEAYEACVRDVDTAGTVGDLMAIKLQIGELASLEQAHRFRHCSLTRAMAHAAARRYGHGNGPYFSRVSREVADLIAAGNRASAEGG